MYLAEKKVSCNHDATCIKVVEQQEETISLLIAGKRVLQSSVKAAFNSAIGKYSNGMGHPPVHCNPYDQMYANRHKGKRRSADIKRTYARNFRSEEEKEDDETDGMSFVPGGKKYKEVVSGSKEINSPIPVNVKEFENIPVDNDIHQDLSERNGGNSTNSHI